MRRSLLLAVLGFALTQPLEAQSARPYSIQASGLFAVLSGDAYRNLKSGLGGEIQVRRSFGRGSLGLGLEFTRHSLEVPVDANPVRRLGPFIEPRLVIPVRSNDLAPYVSARLAVLRVSYDDKTTSASQHATGFTINGGGGLLFRLARRANLDLGATVGYTRFGDLQTTGQAGSTSLGSGLNLILRAGISLAL